MEEELYDMCRNILDLHRQRFIIIKNEIENIIDNNIKDDIYIQRKLDELLDALLFYENDDTLLVFRKLCKYYFSINPQATVRYINFYKEQNDPEGVKFGKKIN